MTIAEYNRCVERFSDNVYRFVLKSLRDAEGARDVVQESFLRLWENRAAVVAGKERSYLFTVAYRLLIDRVRERSRFQGGLPDLPEPRETGGWDNLSEVLDRALDTLGETQRNLVLLRDYEGYSYREIGEMTGLSESQVKVYIFRARSALRGMLGGQV